MKEIDFYPEVCEKFERYLIEYLPSGSRISSSFNKSLPQLVEDIESDLGITSSISKSFIPRLKLDILLGVKFPDIDDVVYVLFEVKYLNQLGLAEFSQLVGYLQVSKKINLGLLFLVLKPNSKSPLSNDFNEILLTNNLPMKWEGVFENNETHVPFNTGICHYVKNGGIEWVNTNDVDGISSFEGLATMLMENCYKISH